MLDRSLSNFTDLRSDNMLHLKCSKILDHIQPTGLTFQPCGNRRVGFDSLFMKVDTTTLHRIGGFFVSAFQRIVMVGWMVGASARCFLCSSLSTPFNLPPVFDSSFGRNTYEGASL